MVDCPICGKPVNQANINNHLDSGCEDFFETPNLSQSHGKSPHVSNFFKASSTKKLTNLNVLKSDPQSPTTTNGSFANGSKTITPNQLSIKRPLADPDAEVERIQYDVKTEGTEREEQLAKRLKPLSALQRAAPLAERMRPTTFDDIYGQELIGRDGVLRGLIEADRVPSMILWGGAGTGKTTIARVIANMAGSRFVEINSTSSGVGECKKIFAEAKTDLTLTGRKTIIFCDEIHRFSKSQQDVFLGPVESGQITLIGATTENPSFKVQNALLSRCRTFTLKQLTDEDLTKVLRRALELEGYPLNQSSLIDDSLLEYLAAFSEGDARTALNLLELAINLAAKPSASQASIKSALTKTLVYDRAGDQHYDAISALHKSIRGSDPSAALYYLARMLQSGESPLYIARRLIVVASEDVGLADNTLLPLAISAYTSAEKLGMPEARINLAHAAVALALAPKSTRVYRSLANAERRLNEPGVASLPVPAHLRNAPTRLMREMGFGKEYKYNPMYKDGKCAQEYLPEGLKGTVFLEDNDLGSEIDTELNSAAETENDPSAAEGR